MTTHVLMMHRNTAGLTNITNTYNSCADKQTNGGNIEKSSTSDSTPPRGPLKIEKPTLDAVLCPPKSMIQKETFNPNSQNAQNNNNIEYLAQEPCAMPTLKVLKKCPTLCRNLLSTIDAVDPKTSNIIMFKLKNHKSMLSHQLAFQIITKVVRKNIHRIVLDEGASTSVISLSCWRDIGSLNLNRSPTTLK